MAKSNFGEHLKREREMRGVSLDEISSATRISTRFLEALEREQWDRLPGGVFNRGFVRAVARFLGLDEETLVAEYALAINARPEPAVWAAAAAPPLATARRKVHIGGRSRAFPWRAAALLLALAGGGWFAWHRYAPLVTAWRKPVPEPASPAQRQSPSAARLPEASPGTSGTQADAAEPATLELKIETTRPTLVSVIADGKSVFEGRMSAGQSRQFRAQEQFQVSAGNSTAVLLELNGQMMAPLGTPGRPGRVTLSRKDLKKTPGGPD